MGRAVEALAGRRSQRLTAGAALDAALARRLVAVASSVLLAGGLLAVYYATSLHVVAGNSDGATVLLEGSAIAHGNVALSGWRLSLDSFSLVDAPFYALGVLAFGIRPELMNLVPAILALLVVAACCRLASAGTCARASLAGGCTVVALLALPSPDLAYFLLQGPWHIGTALYCLVAFAAVSARRSPWVFALATALLAAGMLGDLFTLELGVLPILFAGLATAARRRSWRAAGYPVAVALASVVVALGGRLLESGMGAFTLVNRNLPLSLDQIRHNLTLFADEAPALLGVRRIATGPGSNGSWPFQLLHLPGLTLVLVAVALAGWRLGRGAAAGRRRQHPAAGWVEDCLILAVLADFALFVLGAASDNPDYVKYVTPGVLFAVVLAGRLVASFVAAGAADPLHQRRRLAAVLAPLAVLAAGYAWQSAGDLDPAAPQPAAALGQFLLAHHLTEGIGDYWSSSLVTVETGGRVAVRPVAIGYGGLLRRADRQSADGWYKGQRFEFLVYDPSRPWQGVSSASAARTYGAPARTYGVGTYRVLVWRQPVAVILQVPSYHSPLQLYFR